MPFRLTISQRLWLGLGLILALFGAAHFVSVRATHLLDAALSGVVEESEARNAAAYEMQIGLDRMTRAAQAVRDAPGPAQRKQLGEAQAGFERALSSYTALASTDRSRGLQRDIDQRYARYNERVAALVEQADAHSHHLAAYDAHRRQGHARDASAASGRRGEIPRSLPPGCGRAHISARGRGRLAPDRRLAAPRGRGAEQLRGVHENRGGAQLGGERAPLVG
jgi:hypothetical protein